MTAPSGIIRGESITAYHANSAISSTQLVDMRIPALFQMKHVAKTLPREERREFDIGNAAHWLILEGRKALEERTVLQPDVYPTAKEGDKPWTYAANYCKDWRRAQAGKVILSADDFANIDRMAKAVESNPDAVALLTGGESEVTFRVQHPAFAVQCRADHWHTPHHAGPANVVAGNCCVDLKTCESIEQFRAHYFKMRYYYRAAFYQDVISDALGIAGERPAFVFVAVEKNAPWRCEVFEPTESDLELGRTEMLADLKTLRTCLERNEWPGSKLGVQPIELTSWQRKIAEANGAALWEEAVA
jgi:hypothetical protein